MAVVVVVVVEAAAGRVRLLCVALLVGCALPGGVDHGAEIEAALADLRTAGFEFKTDVRFEQNRYVTCQEEIACADLVLREGHRTVRLAPEAFETRSRLRAALLEIWERYERPRRGSSSDLARGSLRVLQDGPRAGVDDDWVLRRAHRAYRRFWRETPEDQREGLPDPARIPLPPGA